MKKLEIIGIDVDVDNSTGQDAIIDVVALGHALNELFYGYTVKEDNDDRS